MPQIDTDTTDKKTKEKKCFIRFSLLSRRFYILIYSR
jgi:hypothetical protein